MAKFYVYALQEREQQLLILSCRFYLKLNAIFTNAAEKSFNTEEGRWL